MENITAATRNPFLSRVCTKLREERPLGSSESFVTRVEHVNGAPFVDVWFRTRGCRHDAQGGCTMCNYGAGPPVTAQEMVDFARRGLLSEHLDERTMVLVSPSGSMFDPWEVPVRARESIFDLVRETPCWCYHCETRAEALTEDGVRRCAEILAGKEVCVELGLESADPWVLKYCINKGLSLDTYRQAVALLRKHHVVPLANVLVGAPFLSPKEAVEDAVRAVRWALANGVERCVVFPVHVKRYTLAEWLWQRDLYAAPSLWSLVEVLATLGPELSNRVTISWYKAYFGEYAGRDRSLGKLFLSSPTTCPDCLPTVMRLLDAYRDTRDFELVKQLTKFDCECKHRWQVSLERKERMALRERVERYYETIGQGIFGQDRRNAGDGVA